MATNTSREEKLAQIKKEMARKQRSRNLVIGAVVLVVVAALVGVGWFLQSHQGSGNKSTAATPANLSGPYSVMIGKSSAPTTLKIYEDFQCPVCDDLEKATGTQVQAALDAGKIKIDLHMLAFLDRSSSTNYSSRAFNAAMAVLDTAGVDAFWKMHKILYDNQPAEGTAGLPDSTLIDFAVQAGADKAKVSSLINDNSFHDFVVKATDQMTADGVNGTPTVFVNGKNAGATLGDSINAVLAAAAQ